MSMYTVTQRIQSVRIDGNEPVDVQFYCGDDKAEAIVALAQASLHSDPEWVVLRSVTMTVVSCVWETNQYQRWAQVPCSGSVIERTREGMTGLLCAAHADAWDLGVQVPHPSIVTPMPTEGLVENHADLMTRKGWTSEGLRA